MSEQGTSEQGTEPQVPATDAPIRTPGSKSARRRTPCAICGKEARDARAFGLVRPAIAQTMLVDHPELTADSTICGRHAAPYRSQYVTELLARERGELSELEQQVARKPRPRRRRSPKTPRRNSRTQRTFGERAGRPWSRSFGGSWNFIISFFGWCWSSGWRSTSSGRHAAPSTPIRSSCSIWCCPASPPSRRRSS